METKFKTHDRVMVREIQGPFATEHNGAFGKVVEVAGEAHAIYRNLVVFDKPTNRRISEAFADDELSPVTEITLTGLVNAGYDKGAGNYFITIGKQDLWPLLHFHNGRLANITILVEEVE